MAELRNLVCFFLADSVSILSNISKFRDFSRNKIIYLLEFFII